MLKIMVDDTFIKALIFEDYPNHEIADRMSKTLTDTKYLFLPSYTLNHLFDEFNNQRDDKTRKFFENICFTTRTITEISKKLKN